MKKRILAMFLAVCTLMSFAVIGASAEENPVNQMPDYKTLAEAQPSIKLNDVPEGSTDVRYGWLNNIPAIDQIDFTYDGHTYCFRAAACPAGTASLDISGVYGQFPSISTVEVSGENQAGGSYTLRYDSQSGKGLANWNSEMAETQYSLYSETACKGDRIEDMPFVKVMEKLFIYDQGAKTVSGTVLDTTKNTLALNLTNGSSVVLNCEHIKNVTVKNGDTVDVYYLGEISGDAQVVRIVPSGSSSSAPAGNTFSGNIFKYSDNLIYVLTDDENIFPFEVTSSTVVSGAANRLAENEDVVVTFNGDLYSVPYVPPVALEVNVTYVGVAPTPEPIQPVIPVPAPAYIDRNIDGIVTSVCGIWVTVNGTVFEVNGANCQIYGQPKVGGYGSINFRDFGNYKVVTSAHFADLPAPVPAPVTYWECKVCGYLYNTGDRCVNCGCTPSGETFRWKCKACGVWNDEYDVYCGACGLSRSGSGYAPGVIGWVCSVCQTANRENDEYCVNCGTSRSGTSQIEVANTWTCGACGTVNGEFDVYCSKCGTSRSGTGHIEDVQNNSWVCGACGTTNGEFDVYCSKCGTSRSGTGHIETAAN